MGKDGYDPIGSLSVLPPSPVKDVPAAFSAGANEIVDLKETEL